MLYSTLRGMEKREGANERRRRGIARAAPRREQVGRPFTWGVWSRGKGMILIGPRRMKRGKYDALGLVRVMVSLMRLSFMSRSDCRWIPKTVNGTAWSCSERTLGFAGRFGVLRTPLYFAFPASSSWTANWPIP